MKIAIQTFRLQEWFGGDIWPVIDLIRRAEEIGVAQVDVPDHIVRVEDPTGYPYGKPTTGANYPWFEPVALLAAIAAVTKRIRLSTGILVSPVRPAPLLAKQLATLDHVSRGRVDIGIGVGWQRAEYDSSSIPWERRFSRMTDQIRACKALWSQVPATHHGEFYSFDDIYSLPLPVQAGGVPVWFGFALNDRNLDRIAELGDGWLPAEGRPDVLAREIAQIKAAMVEKGRDPTNFQVRVRLRPSPKEARPLDALKRIGEYADAGVTVLSFHGHDYCDRPEEFEEVLAAAVAEGAKFGPA
jgi:probable F420-dependent oxidoreductase